MRNAPKLSIILLLSRRYAWLRRTIHHWASQGEVGAIEVIIVRPIERRDAAIVRADLSPFWGSQVIDVPSMESVADGFVAGVRAARGPIVMLAEDHAFPEPGLAAAMLEAYDDPRIVAAGPVMCNANPVTRASRSAFVVAFSAVGFARATRAARSLGGHNASYRRDTLLAFGDDLPELYRSERVLQFEIEARDGEMMLVAGPRMAHYNFSRWRPMIVHAFTGGRLFGAQRCRAWGWPRRLLYIAAAPLIPAIRLLRIGRDLRESPPDFWTALVGGLPAIAFTLSLHALGEVAGYALGLGNAAVQYAPFELYRRDQLLPSERLEIDNATLA